jgi:16S rRNA (uracil1498-N3)-methyltransferase
MGGDRSVVRLDGAGLARRCEHWRAVAISACEQCGRNRVPTISHAADLASACGEVDATSVRLLLAPDADQTLIAAARQASRIALAIGPEGGFSDEELSLAQQQGFTFCRLGPRMLRAETAPLAALAAIQAVAGDFLS